MKNFLSATPPHVAEGGLKELTKLRKLLDKSKINYTAGNYCLEFKNAADKNHARHLALAKGIIIDATYDQLAAKK